MVGIEAAAFVIYRPRRCLRTRPFICLSAPRLAKHFFFFSSLFLFFFLSFFLSFVSLFSFGNVLSICLFIYLFIYVVWEGFLLLFLLMFPPFSTTGVEQQSANNLAVVVQCFQWNRYRVQLYGNNWPPNGNFAVMQHIDEHWMIDET